MAHGKIETDYTEDYIASKIVHTYFYIYYLHSNYLDIPVVTLAFGFIGFLLLCLCLISVC